MRRLQFSGVDTSAPPPMSAVKSDEAKRVDNKERRRGKPLTYVPSSLRNGKKCVTIVKDDLAELASYWSSTCSREEDRGNINQDKASGDICVIRFSIPVLNSFQSLTMKATTSTGDPRGPHTP
ncbi:uncharacterized protein LOC129896969 [Solanum dulcamara]|uniref:uncharacterized protein LOC129896969 n=1 Tax=Solanum dulcamara TaxID=45834 RepID=UPI0024854199|nr:uncharacterized protein LOC129896969 [Solanum dulcamara]